ncbi:carboxypeptidase regulatory-like domain-containing protein [soil metagenome]
MKRKLIIILTAIFMVSGYLATAQETTSEIQGLVTDSKGTPLAGATIVAIHTPTGSKYTTTTRKDGRFNLANLRIGGPYTISETYVGFRDEKLEGVTLSLGQVYKADFTLTESAAELQTVTVSALRQNKVINNGRTGQQEIITRSQLERLPSINRSLQDFTKLEPTSNGLNFGGRSSQYNNVTVDGANFNNSFGLSPTLGGQTSSQPISLDAVEQIQVNTSPYDVRQGGFSGAGVNTVTKSGTNQFKGSVYYYNKNENYQGYNVSTVKVPKIPIDFGIKGFSLGGPIIKNKLFFFVSGEQVHQALPATSYLASRPGLDPANGSISQANGLVLDTLSKFLLDKFGYQTGAYEKYNLETKSDKLTAKIDWNINSKSTLTIKYNYLKSSADILPSTSRNGFSGFSPGQSPGFIAMPFQSSGYVINNNFNIIIAELNTRLSNKASNKFQVGYTALRDYRSSKGNIDMPLVDILSGPGNNNVYTTFGYETFTYNNKLNTNTFQVSDIFTFYKGSHEITVGTQNYFRKYLNGFAPAYQGAYQFQSIGDFYNSVNNGTLATRYALQYSALKGGAFPFAEAGVSELGLFGQDKWRLTNNFTLTYGLRIDYSTYTGTFDQNPDFAALTFANGTKYDVGKKPTSRPLVSPRLGFNWDASGDKTLQIRGGAGIFSGPPPFVWISNQASNNGVQFGQQIFSGATAVPFSADPNTYRPQSGAANANYAIAISDPNFKYPTVMKSSLAVDKKLPGDYIVTLEGAYSKDINAVYYSNINLNQASSAAIVFAGADPRVRYGAVTGTTNKIYSGAGGATAANPNITNVILMKNTGKGYSWNATARVQKTFKDFYMSIAYTYSVAKNTAEFGSTSGGLWSSRPVQGDPNTANLAYAGWNQPHRVVAFASYKFNYAKYFGTTVGLFFEAAPNGVTSYVYNGDVNNDGNNANDLIYIPRSASEIALVNSASNTGTGFIDTRTTAQIWTQLNNFISQDKYLSSHRGQVAAANAVVLPFYKKLDLNVTQSISLKTGKERHTVQVSLDILNLGNLLNKQWGLVKVPSVTNFLAYRGLAADGKTPTYSFTYQNEGGQIPYTNSFVNSTSIASRWQMQIGFRYIFN